MRIHGSVAGLKCAPLAIALLVLTPAEAPAEMMTFVHAGAGSGTFDGTPFPASDFVITATGETDDRYAFYDGDGWWINHTSASIWIDGVGEFEFLTGTRTFVNNSTEYVGFSRAKYPGEPGGADLFDGPHDAAFADWDMLSPIGPISGDGTLMQWQLSPQIVTAGGILFFPHHSDVYTTFTAIPEPTTLAIFAFGGIGLVLRRR